MKKYRNTRDIQNIILSENMAHLTYHATEIYDIIHPFSIPGYEYLSGGLVAFFERFRSVLPASIPIVLEIKGKQFTSAEKATIGKAVWMHYGLYLSEAAEKMKKTRTKMLVYLLLMILSSVFLFMVANVSDEVVVNYGYLLFWFFAYRLLTHLLLDCLPIYREYQWYRGLASLKLLFPDDEAEAPDTQEISAETAYYAHEATSQARKHGFVNQVLMEDSCISLGCSIRNAESVLSPSGAESMEIISDELADYLMSALPFMKKKTTTRLEVICKNADEQQQSRLSSGIRNYLSFVISRQDAEQKANRDTSILFTICFLLSTVILYAWGKNVDVAVHEFFLVLFWFFGDYLLEFILLSRMEISTTKKTLKKLAEMDISFIP